MQIAVPACFDILFLGGLFEETDFHDAKLGGPRDIGPIAHAAKY